MLNRWREWKVFLAHSHWHTANMYERHTHTHIQQGSWGPPCQPSLFSWMNQENSLSLEKKTAPAVAKSVALMWCEVSSRSCRMLSPIHAPEELKFAFPPLWISGSIYLFSSLRLAFVSCPAASENQSINPPPYLPLSWDVWFYFFSSLTSLGLWPFKVEILFAGAGGYSSAHTPPDCCPFH